MYLGNLTVFYVVGPDRLQSIPIRRDFKVIATPLAHESDLACSISYSEPYYRQQPHYHPKMAEIKRPVGLLFDIGGVCVSRPLDPETLKIYVSDNSLGCISLPGYS
jgi:hypothetical protein